MSRTRDEADLVGRVARLERLVQTLATNNRVAAASISAGGSFAVGGRDGANVFFVGDLSNDGPDGFPQRGVIIRRSDAGATVAFSMFDPNALTDGFRQFWALWDRQGNIIASEDANSGEGLATPYIGSAHLVDTDSSRWPTFSNTSTQDWLFGRMIKQHPKIRVDGQINCDAGSSAEITLVADPVGGVAQNLGTIAATGFERWSFEEELPGFFQSTVELHLEGRRTAGTGSIHVIAHAIYGVQS